MISQQQLQPLLPPVIAISQQAGAAIMVIYETDFAVEHKTDKSPVTTADMAANTLIIEALQALTPQWPVLSEEAADYSYDVRKQWETYWLVDPLDGTREFVKRNDEFSVNIALIHQHQSVLGVVYAPALKTSYYASRSGGAYRMDAEGNSKKIQVRTLCENNITVAGSRSHRNERLGQYLYQLGPHTRINVGSSLKSCWVAEGKVDLYPRLGPTSEWDTAAAQCIVEEAGGFITDTKMQALRYNTKASLLNPHFFVFGDKRKDWSEYLPANDNE